MAESASSKPTLPQLRENASANANVNGAVDPDKLVAPEGELGPADEEDEVESDEYEVQDDEEEYSGEEDEDDGDEGGQDPGLTHLLLGGNGKVTRPTNGTSIADDDDDEEEDDDEDDDDEPYVPDGGVEPAEQELDGYARDPALVPAVTLVTGGKRARDEDEEDSAAVVNGNGKRAKA